VRCYRLYDRDIPEIPLVIDWYEGRLHVAEFQKKDADPECSGEAWMATVLAPTAMVLQVPEDKLFFKVRDRQRGQQQYQAKGADFNRVEVSECGHRFLVNLVDYLDTGLFLDHRRTRAMVAQEAEGKAVLNLYCYTGSFSVYAAAAGAATTLGIDLSGTYLDWARANLDLNGLDKSRNRLHRGDVLEQLAELDKGGEKFDLVVVDPPTFSNSKALEGVFDVQRDHVALLLAVRKVLAADGVVYFSTNHRRFRLDENAIGGAYQVVDISAKTQPLDYRDQKIHRCWRMVAVD
jgi:23S rRNA G2069 N7-methylase RlmK/C1962 C5-methylase RlmI